MAPYGFAVSYRRSVRHRCVCAFAICGLIIAVLWVDATARQLSRLWPRPRKSWLSVPFAGMLVLGLLISSWGLRVRVALSESWLPTTSLTSRLTPISGPSGSDCFPLKGPRNTMAPCTCSPVKAIWIGPGSPLSPQVSHRRLECGSVTFTVRGITSGGSSRETARSSA